MNKIYCVIWCHIRQAYVVASELASRKKIKSQKQGRTILMMKGLFLSSLIGISSTVLAEENRLNIGQDDGDVIYIGDYDTINPSAFSGIVIGQETVLASGNDVIIIGTGASTHGTNAISIGTDTKSEGDSVAIGAGAEAVSGGIAIGMGSRATASDEFSVGSKDNERKITNVRSGNIIVDSKDAVNGSQLYTALYSVIDVIGKDSNGQVSNGVISGVDFSRAFDLKRNYITNVYDGFAFTNTRTKELASVLGGSAKITNGTFFGPIYDFGELDEDGNKITYNTVGAALDNIDGRVDINTINIENITTGKAGLVQLSESGEIVIDNTIAGTDEAVFNLQNADGTARQVTGVEKAKLNADSTDAVNGAQLHVTNENVAQNTVNITKNSESITQNAGNITKNSEGITQNTENITKNSESITQNAGNITKNSESITQNTENITKNSEGITQNAGNITKNSESITQNAGNITKNSEGITQNTENIKKTNESLVTALGSGVTLDDVGNLDLTALDYKEALGSDQDLGSIEAGFEYVGTKLGDHDAQLTQIGTSIGDITTGKAGLVQLSESGEIVIDNTIAGADKAVFNLQNADGTARQVTGVERAELNADSTDAVNGAQLHATNENVAGNTANITKNTEGIAQNTENIKKTNESLVTALGAGVTLDDVGNLDLTALDYKEALGSDQELGSIEASFEYVGTKLGDHDAQLTQIGTSIGDITTGKAGLVQLSESGEIVIDNTIAGADKAVFNLQNADGTARQVTGVERAELNADSTDAVNGAQLHATNENVAQNTVNITKNSESITQNTENITKNSEGITQNTENITKNSESITQNAGNITKNSESITQNTENITKNSEGITQNAGNITKNSESITQNTENIKKTNESLVTALGAGVMLDDVGNMDLTALDYKEALGSDQDLGSIEAGFEYVGTKLGDHDAQLTQIGTSIGDITTGKAGLVQLSESGEIVIDNTISGADEAAFNLQNADGTARQVTGVEKGDITTESVDAINGSQLLGSLKSLETILGAEVTVDSHGYVSVPSSTFDIGQGNNTISGALNYLNNQSGGGEGLFTYDKDKNQVIFADSAGVKADAELNLGGRVISGVKGGDVAETSSQVVTGSQLWETNQQVEENTQQLKHIQNTFSHYNARLHNIEKTVHQNRKVASAGISGAMAMSSIPYVDHTKYSFGMGAATYDGEAAMSIGFTYKVNQDARFRIQGSYDTQNKAGVGIGFAFGF